MQALVCLLLALASVEAAVADARYPPTLGKAFTVPRIRQSTGRLRDGFATQEKTFLKYSWTDVPVKGAVFSAIPGGKSGSVNVTAEDYLAAYIAPVEIGGQRLNLDFDTGSSDLWVFSSRLGPGATAGHNVFDPNKSKTFRNATDLTWHITYGDGSGAAGVVGTDTVNIGGATVTKQAVELATVMSSSFIRDTDSDGLLGLAFKKLNRVQPTQQNTFFGNIKSSLKRPLFTVDFRNDGSGSYDFGFIDQSKYAGNITHIGINTTAGHWQFASPSFEVDGKPYNNSNSSPAIADTGTSLMIVDPSVAEEYWSHVPNAIYSGAYLFPCVQTLPSFGVAIGRRGYKITIPGEMLNYAPVNRDYCYGGIQSNRGNPYQVYGDLMFRSSFVVFYGGAGNLGLGFAAKSGS